MRKKRVLSLILAFVLISAISLTVLANTKTVDVLYDNISILLDGKKITSDAEPFILNGRTYTPARLVAEALGAKVEWDAKSNSVKIESPKKVEPTGISGDVAKIMGSSIESVDALGTLVNIGDINSLMFGEFRSDLEFLGLPAYVVKSSNSGYSDLVSDINDFISSYNKAKEACQKYINSRLSKTTNSDVKECLNDVNDTFSKMDNGMKDLKALLDYPSESNYKTLLDTVSSVYKARKESAIVILNATSKIMKEHYDSITDMLKKSGVQSTTNSNNSSSTGTTTTGGDDPLGGLDGLFKSPETEIVWDKDIKPLRDNLNNYDFSKYSK